MMTETGIPCELVQKLEHIGIAVDNLEAAGRIYTQLLGVECYKIEEVVSEGVRTAFYHVGETKIELLEALHEQSPVAAFLRKRGPGLHHIAFDVKDIQQAMQRLRELGFTLTSDDPRPGADNKLVCFVHPRSAGGVLVELCQEQD